jgi:Tat protein translocase TatB subunit
MFGIGFPELIVICIVALIFIGPKKLPDLMRQGGKLFVQLRRTANDVRSSFDQVVHEAEEELRKSEAEALRQAILADHVKSPKLLDAATVVPPGTGNSHDPDGHEHVHGDHHYHDHHHDDHHHGGELDHAVHPVTDGQPDPHRPDGAQPFQPNLLGSVSPKSVDHQRTESTSEASAVTEQTPSGKSGPDSGTTEAQSGVPPKSKEQPIS